MSNLAKLEIAALDVSGKNYMAWTLDANMHLRANDLLKAIDQSETIFDEKKARAMIYLRHHLHDDLKNEYITKEDPADLWNSLKDRYDHRKYVILPKARHVWLNLRFHDYKSVGEYNSALFGITSRMILCGERVSDFDMIEKTLQTFHPSNLPLQEQYRLKGFTQYSKLMQMLLVAEQNNELVMLNHSLRPTGSEPFPEANAASSRHNNWQERGRRYGRGRFRGRGRGCGQGQGRKPYLNEANPGRITKNSQRNDVGRTMPKHNENNCLRCGMKGHWARTCRAPKYFADLYQESQKVKRNNVETNFIADEPGPFYHGINDDMHVDITDALVESRDINDMNE